MSSAKKVIKKIVSDTNLTAGANFGLMEWSGKGTGGYAKIRVGITNNGARLIYSDVDGIRAKGGTNLRCYSYERQREIILEVEKQHTTLVWLIIGI